MLVEAFFFILYHLAGLAVAASLDSTGVFDDGLQQIDFTPMNLGDNATGLFSKLKELDFEKDTDGYSASIFRRGKSPKRAGLLPQDKLGGKNMPQSNRNHIEAGTNPSQQKRPASTDLSSPPPQSLPRVQAGHQIHRMASSTDQQPGDMRSGQAIAQNPVHGVSGPATTGNSLQILPTNPLLRTQPPPGTFRNLLQGPAEWLQPQSITQSQQPAAVSQAQTSLSVNHVSSHLPLSEYQQPQTAFRPQSFQGSFQSGPLLYQGQQQQVARQSQQLPAQTRPLSQTQLQQQIRSPYLGTFPYGSLPIQLQQPQPGPVRRLPPREFPPINNPTSDQQVKGLWSTDLPSLHQPPPGTRKSNKIAPAQGVASYQGRDMQHVHLNYHTRINPEWGQPGTEYARSTARGDGQETRFLSTWGRSAALETNLRKHAKLPEAAGLVTAASLHAAGTGIMAKGDTHSRIESWGRRGALTYIGGSGQGQVRVTEAAHDQEPQVTHLRNLSPNGIVIQSNNPTRASPIQHIVEADGPHVIYSEGWNHLIPWNRADTLKQFFGPGGRAHSPERQSRAGPAPQ